jgi:hypothetical protein
MSEIGLAWPFSTSFAQENDKDGISTLESLDWASLVISGSAVDSFGEPIAVWVEVQGEVAE